MIHRKSPLWPIHVRLFLLDGFHQKTSHPLGRWLSVSLIDVKDRRQVAIAISTLLHTGLHVTNSLEVIPLNVLVYDSKHAMG